MRAAPLTLAVALAACAPPPPVLPAVAPPLGAVAGLRSGTPPRCVASGAALHLGEGWFITAAHLVDGSVQRLRGGCPPGRPAVTLSAGGVEAPARLLRAGRDRVDPVLGQRYLAGEDLAVLAPLAALPQAEAALLCPLPPPPGTPALLVTPRGARFVRLSGPVADREPGFGAYLEIAEALQPGDSGGAAFEAASGCLAGLVSHREEGGGPLRTRLVPAAAIRRFLGL